MKGTRAHMGATSHAHTWFSVEEEDREALEHIKECVPHLIDEMPPFFAVLLRFTEPQYANQKSLFFPKVGLSFLPFRQWAKDFGFMGG